MNKHTIPRELAGTEAEDLFLMMAMKDDPEMVRQGFLEFYSRFSDYLRRVIHAVCSQYDLYGAEIEEVLFDNTLNRVVEKADKFTKVEKEKGKEQKENRIKSWLGKVAENELKQIIRKGQNDSLMIRKLSDEQADDSDIFIIDDSPPASRLTPEELRYFHEAMLTLTNQQVLVLRYIYLHRGTGKYLESEIIQYLAIQLKITKDAVRQIHYRAIQKLKQYIQSKNKTHEQPGRQPNYERRNL